MSTRNKKIKIRVWYIDIYYTKKNTNFFFTILDYLPLLAYPSQPDVPLTLFYGY